MLTAEVKVNGIVVELLVIVNCLETVGDESIYRYERYRLDDNCKVDSGNVLHTRKKNNALELIGRVIEACNA